MVRRCATEENLTLGQALGRVLDYVISYHEARGYDYTDDDLVGFMAKRAVRRFPFVNRAS